MIHRAAGLMRRWEEISDQDVNTQLIIQIFDKAEGALNTAGFMVQSLSQNLSQYPQSRPSRAITKAWNIFCDSIKGGASTENAGRVAASSAPYVDGPGVIPHRDGAIREWHQREISLPEQFASNPSSS